MIELKSRTGKVVRVEGIEFKVDGLEDFKLFVVNAVSPDGKILDDQFFVMEEFTGFRVNDTMAASTERSEALFRKLVRYHGAYAYRKAFNRQLGK